jgi:hypothetical protein
MRGLLVTARRRAHDAPLVARHSLLVRRSLPVARRSSFVVRRSSLVVRRSSFVALILRRSQNFHVRAPASVFGTGTGEDRARIE